MSQTRSIYNITQLKQLICNFDDEFNNSLMLLFIFIILFYTASSTVYFTLSNVDNNIMYPGDTLISTLGYYRLTLISYKCAFFIENFSNGQYNSVTKYSPVNISSCQSITITSDNIFKADTVVIMSFSNLTCNETKFLIDDIGLARMICVQQGIANAYGKEINYTFASPPSNFFATSNISITKTSTLNTIKNNGNWAISAKEGMFILFKNDNASINVVYNYTGFQIYPSFLVDWLNNQPPYLFPGLKYYPQCGLLNGFNFKAPFLFYFDPYWPQFTILDHSGYLLLKISYPNIDCLNDYGLVDTKISRCEYSLCPPQLFQYQGDCVSQCPLPYFHSIKQNDNRCLLNCQRGATIDNISRICTCGLYQSINCSTIPYTQSTILGCNCTLNLFFDGYGCVQICPIQKIGLKGICVSCPYKCATCEASNYSVNFAYLKCKTCINGYSLNNDGLCVASCNNLQGKSMIAGVCVNCIDPNCISCNPASICLRCSGLFTLQNNQCKLNCNSTNLLVYASYSTFTCVPNSPTCTYSITSYFSNISYVQCLLCLTGFIYGNTCVADCTRLSLNLINNLTSKACDCADPSYLMINTRCYKLNNCPLKMYLNPTTGVCLSCGFGCIKCNPNSLICYRCSPGYILMAYNMTDCVYNSPFFTCPVNCHLKGGYMCVPNIVSLTSYSNCHVSQCLACAYNSEVVCILCITGNFLYENTCLSICPSGTFVYQNSCIDEVDLNCQVFSIGSRSNYVNMNKTLISFPTTAYLNFYSIAYNNQSKNNVAAGIIYATNDTSNRLSYFSQALTECKLCNQGYSIGNDGICYPCIYPCSTCVALNNYSCSSCVYGYYVGNGRQCIQYGANCMPGQFRNDMGRCVFNCYQFYLVNSTSNSTNCSQCCPNNLFPTNNGSSYLICALNNSQTQTPNRFISVVYNVNGNYQIFLIPLDPLKINSKTSPPIMSVYSKRKRLLQETITNITSTLISFNPTFISIIVANSTDIIILNFSNILSSYSSTTGTYFSDSVIGIDLNNSRETQLHSNLYWIGLINSVILLIMHIIFIGNDLMYKVDNVIIYAQVLFYFVFMKSIDVPLISSFLYGWSSSHLSFMPNYLKKFIPLDYVENAPYQYKLVTLDSNIVRNAGYSFEVFFIFLALYLLIIMILYAMSNIKKTIWQPKMQQEYLLAIFELVFPNILYFSIVQLLYRNNPLYNPNHTFLVFSQILSIVSLSVIGIYSLVRTYYNTIGGIYCFKRIALILVLIVANYYFYLNLLLILMELIFLFVRIKYEQNEKFTYILVQSFEQILKMFSYLLLIFSNNDYFLVISISALMILFTFLLLLDLVQLYFLKKIIATQIDFTDGQQKGEYEIIKMRKRMNKLLSHV